MATERDARKLLPFQTRLLDDFLAPGSPAIWELAVPTGAGKTSLSIEIVRRFSNANTHARLLILVAGKALAAQWHERVKHAVPHALLVDRPTLLELEASTSRHALPWPSPALVVMTMDLARRDGVLEVLKRVTWDLVVVDESPLFAGKRGEAFFELLSSGNVRRGLVLSNLPQTRTYPSSVRVERRVYALKDIVDWDGNRIFEPAQLSIRVLEYRRSGPERQLIAAIEEVATKLNAPVRASELRRAAASSLLATEVATRRVKETLAHAKTFIGHGRSTDISDPEASSPTTAPDEARKGETTATDLDILLVKVERILEILEDISTDSKLDAFVNYAAETVKAKPYWMCVWASYLATGNYLFSSLEQRLAVPLYRLSGSIAFDERQAVLDRFRAEGGILITSGPPLEGIGMTFVDECVHYDLPADPRLVDQRLGRFLRIGRNKPFQSVLLKDLSDSLAWETATFTAFALASSSFARG